MVTVEPKGSTCKKIVNTKAIPPTANGIVRQVGYGQSLEGASAAHLMKSIHTKGQPVTP